MSWTFNPPPGWPAQPEGWVPPPGWTPDPGWPPAPAGWQFWLPAPAPPAPPAPPPPAPIPPTLAPPAPLRPGPHPGFPHPPGPAGGRLWFTRWWGVLALAGALAVGILLGFAGTSLGLDAGMGPHPGLSTGADRKAPR